MRDMNYTKNYKMANKGMVFEQEVKMANTGYKNRGIALIQKISTPWKVVRRGKQIVSAFPEEKSTLDFRGTVKGGTSISFDCKEVEKEDRGLPLKYIEPHQIDYMKAAVTMNEVTFILCFMKTHNKRYLIRGEKVLQYWDRWQQNKGKRGFNYIPVETMVEVEPRNGIVLDYLSGLGDVK
ncbi:Holliday junction resolvase RecU [Marinisporobacter balticus]|uniref:Holliday junction resolvase RecU n=1 Tax=Marinisporobacter balticus TaxID=2018667 RepID=A0A4R2KX19_9FIRM|nr:Holliday junction resolvase RecU [Marinisporobacter balticus]TCO79111.1 recombination protein U [Marinisporobacter balticus]